MRIRDDQGWHGDLSETWNYENLPKMIRQNVPAQNPETEKEIRMA